MNKPVWKCPKCANNKCETDYVSTAGRGWSRFLNVENRRFTVITCSNCKYSEFYKTKATTLENIIDFIGN